MNEVKFKANIKDLKAVETAIEAIPAIPAPTVANAGKVLTVTVDSSGETPVAEYGLAEAGGGGGGVFLTVATYDETIPGLVLNKTVQEILAAIESSVIVIKIVNGPTTLYRSVVSTIVEAGNYSFAFYDLDTDEHSEATAQNLTDYPVILTD